MVDTTQNQIMSQGDNISGNAYLPYNFTAAELASIQNVEFYLHDTLDQFSITPWSGALESPDIIQFGGVCDPRQGVNVCEGNFTCFSNDPNADPTCQ